MTLCLPDYTLWALSEGDGTPQERDHVAGCALCAWRAQHLAEDLGVIARVLGDEPPRAGTEPQPSVVPLRWLAVTAALLFLAFSVARWSTLSPVQLANPDGIAVINDMADEGFDEPETSTFGAETVALAAALDAGDCQWDAAGCRDLAQPLF